MGVGVNHGSMGVRGEGPLAGAKRAREEQQQQQQQQRGGGSSVGSSSSSAQSQGPGIVIVPYRYIKYFLLYILDIVLPSLMHYLPTLSLSSTLPTPFLYAQFSFHHTFLTPLSHLSHCTTHLSFHHSRCTTLSLHHTPLSLYTSHCTTHLSLHTLVVPLSRYTTRPRSIVKICGCDSSRRCSRVVSSGGGHVSFRQATN